MTIWGFMRTIRQDAADGRVDGVITRDHRDGTSSRVHGGDHAETIRVRAQPAGHTKYPAPDDVEGWKNFLREHGYEAFMKALREGRVGDKVMENKQFLFELQDAQGRENRYWMALTNMQAEQHRLASAIIQNLRG